MSLYHWSWSSNKSSGSILPTEKKMLCRFDFTIPWKTELLQQPDWSCPSRDVDGGALRQEVKEHCARLMVWHIATQKHHRINKAHSHEFLQVALSGL